MFFYVCVLLRLIKAVWTDLKYLKPLSKTAPHFKIPFEISLNWGDPVFLQGFNTFNIFKIGLMP